MDITNKGSYHHTIPANIIKQVLFSKKIPIEERKAQLEYFLNKKHVQNKFLKNNLINVTLRTEHFSLIHCAFIDNPYNLVHGLVSSKRADNQRVRFVTLF